MDPDCLLQQREFLGFMILNNDAVDTKRPDLSPEATCAAQRQNSCQITARCGRDGTWGGSGSVFPEAINPAKSCLQAADGTGSCL